MFCSNCGKETTGKFCINCGTPVDTNNSDDYILNINNESVNISELIRNELNSIKKSQGQDIDRVNAALTVKNLLIKQYKMKPNQAKDTIKEALWDRLPSNLNNDNVAKCPKCGSTSLSADKKGFGISKAVVGAAVAGPIGLIAENIGSKTVRITCLKCGHQFFASK